MHQLVTCHPYSLNQYKHDKGLRLDRRFLLHLNAVLIILVIIDSTVSSVLYCTLFIGIIKSAIFVNAFCGFRAFCRDLFLHDFHTKGVTLKSNALAIKCMFQNYSKLLDICTRLVLKTAVKLFVPSVFYAVGLLLLLCRGQNCEFCNTESCALNPTYYLRNLPYLPTYQTPGPDSIMRICCQTY